MTVSKASLLVIVLVGLLIGYRLLSPTVVETDIASLPVEVPTPTPSTNTTTASAESRPEPVLDEGASLTGLDEPGCLTAKQLEELPEIRQDAARMEVVSSTGEALNAYANLDAETVQSFADQGDSAAMAVLGAMNVMRAYEKNDSQAIGWLNGEQPITDINIGTDRLSPAASLALNEAAYWFYEAASHGRVMALQQYGQVRGRLFGGPVGLGWIDQDELDELSISERNSLIPNNLFGQVSYDIAPELRDGAIGGLLSGLIPTSNKQIEIRERLRDEFNQSLDDRGLPRIEVGPAATTSMEDLFERVCDSVKHEEIRRRSLE